jgi:hypothetical protein
MMLKVMRAKPSPWEELRTTEQDMLGRLIEIPVYFIIGWPTLEYQRQWTCESAGKITNWLKKTYSFTSLVSYLEGTLCCMAINYICPCAFWLAGKAPLYIELSQCQLNLIDRPLYNRHNRIAIEVAVKCSKAE